jgi:hypothetical protein
MAFDPLQTLAALARRRPVFHSEADFQHELAWQLHLDHPHLATRLERRPVPEIREAADLWLTDRAGASVAVEVKYLVRAADVSVDGERFVLLDQSAHDTRRYDVLKDLARVERWTTTGLAQRGLVIVLTNDPGYWRPSTRAVNDVAFRIHEGRDLTGTAAWATSAGAGTTVGRTAPITITGQYRFAWHDYAVPPNAHELRVLVLDTGSDLGPARRRVAGEAEA